MRDAGRTVFKLFFRLEVTGLENIPGPGQRVVIAPNHVSLLDGPLLHTILPEQAGLRRQQPDRAGLVGASRS